MPLLGAGEDGALLDVIAAATPPFERTDRRHFRVRDRSRAGDRMERWLATAPPGEVAGADLQDCFADVEVRDPRRLPDWAGALVAFLRAQPETLPPLEGAAALRRMWTLLERPAAGLLAASGGVPAGLEVTDAALAGMAGQLGRRLAYCCAAAVDFELGHLDAGEIDATRSGWLQRLDGLRGLGFVIGVACLHWQRATAELLRRLATDLPLLRDELWAGAAPGPLTGFSGDAGDLHDGGRSVAVLTFASGRRAVYKPKDLRCAAGVIGLLGFLNGRGLEPALAARVVLPRGAYAWEEHVAAGPCGDAGGPGRFYRRLGMLTRLLQLLEGSDFWVDNLLAAGDQPVFVDLETILQPRPARRLTARARAQWETLAETVVPLGVVTSPQLLGPGTQAVDLGALAPAGVRPSPLRPGLDRLQAAGGGLTLLDGRLAWEPVAGHPIHGGEPADPRRHLDELVRGYRHMSRVLRRAREELAAPGGPLAALEDCRIRHIRRSTWTYLAVLGGSLRPGALADGVAREVALAGLLRSAAGDQVARHELAALRRLDVPLFLSSPSSDALLTADGGEFAGRFEGTAWARLRARLAGLADFPVEAQVGVLRTCLAAPAARRRRLAPAPPAAPEPGDLLGLASALGDQVLAAAVRGADGSPAWLGLRWRPVHGLRAFEALGRDLLDGDAGLAVMFAELAARTGAARFAAAAERLLEGMEEPAARRPPGGFIGSGSALYALARCGRTERALALVRSLAGAEVQAGGDDVVLGRTGLLLVLAGLLDPSGPPPASVPALAGSLVPAGAGGAAWPPGADALREQLPSAGEGAALALSRAHRAGLWLGAPAIPPLRPACGGLLAALATARALRAPTPLPLRQGVDAALAAAGGQPSARLLGLGEVAVEAWRTTACERYLDAAHRVVGELVGRRHASGKWFGDRAGPDEHNLSVTDGLPALALLLLRVGAPETPSIRLLSFREE